MRNVSDKFVYKIKTHIFGPLIFPPRLVPFMK